MGTVQHIFAGELECSNCGQWLPVSNFYKVPKSSRGYDYRCKPCVRAKSYSRLQTIPREKQAADAKKRWLKRKYNLTQEEYDALWEMQEHSCASCFISEKDYKGYWHIDHNHETKIVRGILCHNCNIIVGLAYENVEKLKSIIKYIEGF